jgi:hypothetical protein
VPSLIPKSVRMQLFLERLAALPRAATHGEARRLVDDTLNEVEDEHSGVPFNPQRWRTDGRMYPVQDDNAGDVPGHPEVTSYRSFKHETLIRENGAIEIRLIETNEVVLQKAGADGRGVWR